MSEGSDAFVVISINHESVPLEERERYSVDSDKVASLYQHLGNSGVTSESLVLSTCNRFELYAKIDQSINTHDFLVDELSGFYGVDKSQIHQHAHVREGQEAVQHLIEVSAGLRSQIAGEAEIFGQVKAAYADCQRLRSAGKLINRVFQKGFQAAKIIRHSTPIGEGQINISNVAVDLSAKIFGSLSRTKALVLGTGEIGEKTVKALRSRGTENFGIVSRNHERAIQVAIDWGGKAESLDQIGNHLTQYDIILASIGSEEAVITYELVKQANNHRDDRPLFLIDLGMPRNIEATCDNVENVFLYNLDDLARIADENLAERKKAIAVSREIAAERSGTIWKAAKKRGLIQ